MIDPKEISELFDIDIDISDPIKDVFGIERKEIDIKPYFKMPLSPADKKAIHSVFDNAPIEKKPKKKKKNFWKNKYFKRKK